MKKKRRKTKETLMHICNKKKKKTKNWRRKKQPKQLLRIVRQIFVLKTAKIFFAQFIFSLQKKKPTKLKVLYEN